MSSVCGGGHTRNSACGGCGFIPKSVTRQACAGGEKMAGRLPVRRTEMRGGRWRGVGVPLKKSYGPEAWSGCLPPALLPPLPPPLAPSSLPWGGLKSGFFKKFKLS